MSEGGGGRLKLEKRPVQATRIGWRFAGMTDRGQVREHNEDALSLRHGASGAFVVADGLGGHNGGEVASQLAVECLEDELEELLNTLAEDQDVYSSLFNPRCSIETRLREAVLQTNATVFAIAERDARLRGMGCTLLVALIHGEQTVIAHVGDVRAYLWRSGVHISHSNPNQTFRRYQSSQLTQLTTDHTEVARLLAKGLLSPEEALHYPFRHRVERALGLYQNLVVDVQSVSVGSGDRLLFCSDGLWNMLNDTQLATILAEEGEVDACVKRLVREANNAGGEDNITTIVVDMIEKIPNN